MEKNISGFSKITLAYIVYVILLFITNYITFKEIYLPVKDQSDFLTSDSSEFIFSNFLVFNFALKLIYNTSSIIIIALTLYAGAYLLKKDIQNRTFLYASILGHFLFLIPAFLKIFWFLILNNSYTLIDYQTFFQFNLLSLMAMSPEDTILAPLFERLNLIELCLWILLAFIIAKYSKYTFDEGLKLVLSSYVISFLVWTIGLTLFFAGL